jgi:hypothetical protein
VEKTCDRVAIIRGGELARVDRTEALRDLAHHQVELVFTGPGTGRCFQRAAGVTDVTSEDHILRMRVSGNITDVVRTAAQYELADFVSRDHRSKRPSSPSTASRRPMSRRPRWPPDDAATPAMPAAPITRPSLRSRLWGLGSVYGKTIRDSRRAIIAASVLLGLIFIGVTGAIAQQFSTPESRAELVALINAVPPILAGLGGPIVNVGTMGGYLQYKYGSFFPAPAEPLVDPGAVRNTGRRGAARQPRIRGRLGLVQVANRP